MEETWIFERPTGATVRDENDADVPVFELVHTSLGQLDTGQTQPRETESGPATFVSTDPILKTPVAEIPLIRSGDRARCTQLGPGSDPDLLNHTYRVISTPVGSQKTARRWPVRRWE